jgi:hypothetical protein
LAALKSAMMTSIGGLGVSQIEHTEDEIGFSKVHPRQLNMTGNASSSFFFSAAFYFLSLTSSDSPSAPSS